MPGGPERKAAGRVRQSSELKKTLTTNKRARVLAGARPSL